MYDGVRFLRAIWTPSAWLEFCNRSDNISFGSEGCGVKCNWTFSRSLHFCDVFPVAGGWLLKQALRACPVRISDRPEFISEDKACSNGTFKMDVSCGPQVSFLIGHRGEERLDHLLMTVRSIASQEGCRFECIVVEQDDVPRIQEQLPSWVRVIHSPLEDGSGLFCRSAAFNMVAREARGELLVLHDNDMLVPATYGADLWARYQQGAEVVQLKRFVFYLDEKTTRSVFERRSISRHLKSERVIENLEAGGSLAISRTCYFAVGGMDEDFIGWGGEDNEFWDRCRTRKVWDYTTLPIVHLWHASLADRQRETNSALTLLDQKLTIPRDVRISKLRDKQAQRSSS